MPEGRRNLASQPSSLAESRTPPFLCLIPVQTLTGGVHPPWGLSVLSSPPIQMVITSRNTPTGTPGVLSDLVAGRHVACWAIRPSPVDGSSGCARPSLSMAWGSVMLPSQASRKWDMLLLPSLGCDQDSLSQPQSSVPPKLQLEPPATFGYNPGERGS